MPARLTLHFSAAPARELVLPEGCEMVVGRDPECGVAVEDDRVSRRHAALIPGPSGWTLTDLGSKNGTLADGVRVESVPLAEQSWISFGGLVARFEVASSMEALQEERLRRLTTAFEARRALEPGVGLPELLSRVVASTLALANAERGFLLLSRADGDIEVAARSGLSWDDLQAAEFGGSVGAVERVLSGGRAVVSSDARADVLLGSRASVVAGGIRALVCVPVLVQDRRIGVLYADSRKSGAAFTELDLEILESLAAQAGLAIAVARLDGELRQLAEEIAHDSGNGDAGLRARLARQITEVLDRSLSLPAGDRPPASSPGSWNGLLAAHTVLGTPS
ncbi:MAG TPA: GAF domain-containing protein [Thermoanaerobaculia bacterium]|nr:GAF domain-containing protein [Thermoanaerobaculia bacterium]